MSRQARNTIALLATAAFIAGFVGAVPGTAAAVDRLRGGPVHVDGPQVAVGMREVSAEAPALAAGPASRCGDACERRGREIYASCVASGQSAEFCQDRAERIVAECTARSCAPRPAQVTCRVQCEVQGQIFLEGCLAGGGDPDRCRQLAHDYVLRCMAHCPPAPTATPTPNCEGRCHRHAQEVFNVCRARGGSEEACREQQQAAFRECIARECPTRPTPTATRTPNCEDACHRHALEVFNQCRARGGTEEACREQQQAAFRECIARECPPRPTPTATRTPNCEDACRRHAQEVFNACRARGGSEDVCHEQQQAAFRECIARECPPRPTPTQTPPAVCANLCRDKAEAARQACLAGGRGTDACERVAHDTYSACLTMCIPLDAVCVNGCIAHGREVFETCIHNGGDEAACHAQRRAAIDACLAARCRP